MVLEYLYMLYILLRYSGNSYTGSIEMKIIDSMPVIVDGNAMYNANNQYADSMDMAATGAIPRRPKRFRTVSESAVRQPMINEASTHASTSSLRNTNDASNNAANNTTAKTGDKKDCGRASFHLGLTNKEKESDLAPLSDHAEEEEHSS